MIAGSESRCPGFTLIEVILAMSLVSAIAVALASSLQIAYGARTTAVNAAERARTAHLAIEKVAREIANALPPKGILAGPFLGRDPLQAAGTGEVLEFYSARSGRAERGPLADGIHRVSLILTSMRDPVTGLTSAVLGRRVIQNLLSPNQPPSEDEILCRGVQSFQILYTDGISWQDAWDSTLVDNALPTAVQISLAVQDPLLVQNPSTQQGNLAPYRVTRMVYLPMSTAISSTQGSTGSSSGSSSSTGGGR